MRIAQLLVSSAATLLLAGAASSACAQSMGGGGSPPAFTWTGPYLGLNAGADVDGATRFDRTVGALPNNTSALTLGLRPTSHSVHDNGFSGGVQAGYNWELGDRFSFGGFGLVVGAEADAQYMDGRRTDTLSNTTLYGPLDTLGTTPTTRVNEYRGDIDFLGTARARLGVAYNNVLLYGTGGFATGDVKRRIVFNGPNTPMEPFFEGKSSGEKSGYAYGGGVEVAIPTGSFFDRFNVFHATAVTMKAEYLHYDLGSDTLNFPGVNGGATIGAYSARVRTEGDLARFGLNYKF